MPLHVSLHIPFSHLATRWTPTHPSKPTQMFPFLEQKYKLNLSRTHSSLPPLCSHNTLYIHWFWYLLPSSIIVFVQLRRLDKERCGFCWTHPVFDMILGEKNGKWPFTTWNKEKKNTFLFPQSTSIASYRTQPVACWVHGFGFNMTQKMFQTMVSQKYLWLCLFASGKFSRF